MGGVKPPSLEDAMGNAIYKADFYKNTIQERWFRCISSDTTTNLNANTTYTVVPLAGTPQRVDSCFTNVANGVQVTEAGWYTIESLVGFTSATTGVIVQIAIAVNGVVRSIFGTSNDIQSGYGNNTSSAFVFEDILLNANDIVTIYSKRAGNAGTATMLAGSAQLKVRKEPTVGLLRTEAKKTVWVWAEEDATLQTGTNDWSFGAGREGDVNHGFPIMSNGQITKIGFRSTAQGGTALCAVEIYKNGLATGAVITVPSGQQTAITNLTTPLIVTAGDWFYFRTTNQGSTARQRAVVGIEVELD